MTDQSVHNGHRAPNCAGMTRACAEPLPAPVDQADNAQLIAALVLSIAVHAAVLTWTPLFRPTDIEPPPTITVELMPKAETPVVEAPPPAPEVVPEPIVERPPEPETPPEPVVEPPPETPAPEPIVEPPPEPPPPEPIVEPPPEPPPPEPKPKPKPLRKKPAPIKAPPPRPAPEPQGAAPSEPVPPPVPQPPAPEPPPALPVPAETPPPVATPPEPPPPRASFDDNVLDGYAQLLSGAIGRFQKYPRLAQMRGWEGTVEVLLRIAAGGAVREISLVKSSGFDVLDEQALAMVRQATPLPRPPADLAAQDFSVRVPIVFRLQK